MKKIRSIEYCSINFKKLPILNINKFIRAFRASSTRDITSVFESDLFAKSTDELVLILS